MKMPSLSHWVLTNSNTVRGGLGTGTGRESDEAIRPAAYSQREEHRRNRLAPERT